MSNILRELEQRVSGNLGNPYGTGGAVQTATFVPRFPIVVGPLDNQASRIFGDTRINSTDFSGSIPLEQRVTYSELDERRWG